MHRSSIIATVVAAGAILVAGSVASVAVINAASSNAPLSETVALAEPAGDAPPEVLATPSTSPVVAQSAPTDSPTPLPSLSDEPLPALPKVTTPSGGGQIAPAPRAEQKAQPTRKPTKKPAAKASTPKPSRSSSPSPSASAERVADVQEISAERAVELVLNATNGGVVQQAEKEDHGGYDAWAVRVLRHDGSVVTGYVDRVGGVIYDWTTNKEAPQPTSSNSGSNSGDDDDHDDDDDDDHEDDDHESDDDDD